MPLPGFPILVNQMPIARPNRVRSSIYVLFWTSNYEPNFSQLWATRHSELHNGRCNRHLCPVRFWSFYGIYLCKPNDETTRLLSLSVREVRQLFVGKSVTRCSVFWRVVLEHFRTRRWGNRTKDPSIPISIGYYYVASAILV
jgi:hypothetical protein